MAQVLTTFSSLEQSRFQAFKRSAFHADAVEEWVAACLQDRYGDNGNGSIRNSNYYSTTASEGTIRRKLDDLVAPGQAQDIGLVVAMAAKIYAQRLVAEAVSLHEQERSSTNNNNITAATPLPPTAVYRAVRERRRRGVDPGFFLQPATNCFNWAAATASYDVRRLAAEHAQALHDKRHPLPGSPAKDDEDEDVTMNDSTFKSSDEQPNLG